MWDTETYRRLVEAGCDGLTVFQETYDPATYAAVHLKGKKRNYAWRLAAPDRGAEAGMRRLGIGALLGLHPDWRAEAIALAAHARALIQRWWRCEVTVALPAAASGGGRLPARRSGQRPRVRATPVRPAARPARRRDQPVDPGAAGPPRRAGAPRRDHHVGRIPHRARRVRGGERRRAAVRD